MCLRWHNRPPHNRFVSEQGEVTTAVLVVPVAMGLVLAVLQAAFVFHAQAIVDAAVQEGVLAGTTEEGSAELAQQTALSMIRSHSDALLTDLDVTTESNPLQMTVRAQATVRSLIPGYSPAISSVASSPREVFISETP
ncbi:MAG: pilus assembly protein [bacterium]|nr:pilus assembly protein [bacterium]